MKHHLEETAAFKLLTILNPNLGSLVTPSSQLSFSHPKEAPRLLLKSPNLGVQREELNAPQMVFF